MATMIDTPEFKTEAGEALWWEQNQTLLLDKFKEASKNGTLGRGTLARRGLTPTTTIRLDPADIELARTQAKDLGLRYQTYLKMIIHRALLQEATAKATHQSPAAAATLR